MWSLNHFDVLTRLRHRLWPLVHSYNFLCLFLKILVHFTEYTMSWRLCNHLIRIMSHKFIHYYFTLSIFELTNLSFVIVLCKSCRIKIGLLQNIVNLLSLSATDGQLILDNGKYTKLFEERYEHSYIIYVISSLLSEIRSSCNLLTIKKRK